MSEDQQMIHLAEPIDIPEDAQCDIDGVQVRVTAQDAMVVHLDHEVLFQYPTDFTVRVLHSSPTAILRKLESFWKPRWHRSVLPSESDWERMFAFAEQYLPRQPLQYHPISVDQWMEINKRYAATSARGPDAIDRRDLQWMPYDLCSALVQILNRCEATSQWPTALLPGFVFPLPKKMEGTQVGDFRPVILYSKIVRSWSSLRARGCLRHLHSMVDNGQFGFLPGREAAEIWFTLQAYLELAVLSGEERCGWVTDVQKAFENIPRRPIERLAKALGTPHQIVDLWSNFLMGTVRYFQIGGWTGEPIRSNSGFPEGCAMSCYAMGIADLVFHLYLKVYSAMVTPVSFVDNFELIATGVHQLRQGIVCSQNWAEMWRLTLDKAKSYTWATSAKLRQECQTLGWETKTAALDLGAPMTYGKKRSVAALVSRLASVGPLWPLLRRLPVPEWRKWHVLQQGIWAKAFYGCANCSIGNQHIHDLRVQAVKSLKRSKAGTNAFLVLGIQAPMGCDPGFYQFWLVLTTFRRLIQKQPVLLDMWDSFLLHFRGGQSHGPFGKLIDVFNMVGWAAVAAGFYDHDGFFLSWFELSDAALRRVAEDAWAQHVAHEVGKRQDYSDLDGIDLHIFRHRQKRLDGRCRRLLQPIQDGAFLDAKSQSKFDVSKQALCSACGEPDTHAHRCSSCRKFREVQLKHQAIVQRWPSLPKALTHHLIPSRNPHWSHYKTYFLAAEPYLERCRFPDQMVRIDLFTDGSCWMPQLPDFSLGAWAVVCPQLDRWVVRGTLSGLHQHNDVAEVKAIKEALEWTAGFHGEVTVWSDSAYATSGLVRLLGDCLDLPDDLGDGLWCEIQELVRCRSATIYVQHIAAHRMEYQEADPVDAWTAKWNEKADQAAAAAHFLRSPDFLACRNRLLAQHHEGCELLGQLQALQFGHL
eukprot:s191_g29.t1